MKHAVFENPLTPSPGAPRGPHCHRPGRGGRQRLRLPTRTGRRYTARYRPPTFGYARFIGYTHICVFLQLPILRLKRALSSRKNYIKKAICLSFVLAIGKHQYATMPTVPVVSSHKTIRDKRTGQAHLLYGTKYV